MRIFILGMGSCDYDLPSTSWRPKRAGGVIQSTFKDPRSRSINVQGQGKSTSQFKQRESKFALPPPLCPIQALSTWDDAHPHDGHIFTQSIDSSANLFQKHPHRHTQK